MIKFEDILELISYITDIYENSSTMTQYELFKSFLRTDIKEITRKEISQIIYTIVSNNFQQNRRAYNIQKVIKATFSQGHPKFVRTTGIQCTCISLISICFSIFKAVSRWSKHDIHCVLEENRALTNFRTQTEHLQVSVNFLEDNYGF